MIETEGLGKTIVRATQGNRQTTIINKILAHVEATLESLEPEEKQDVVEINLSGYELDKVNIREAIHDHYNAEIIDDHMFIKYDGMDKENIHHSLADSARAHNQVWTVESNVLCTMGNRKEFRPDVGIWFIKPNRAQRRKPIANGCPLPDVWVEVFYNRDPDCSRAFSNFGLAQQQNLAIEFIGIALPYTLNAYRQNPNPGVASTPATLASNQRYRPTRAPYVIYWDINNIPVYYNVSWNKHIVLRCGWTLEFNDFLDVISS